MTGQARRQMSVNLHDTHIGLWQDDPNDPSLRRDIFGGLIRSMRARGWKIGPDPHIQQMFRVLSPMHRLGRRGNLLVEIRVAGRVVELDFWAETWALDNRNGQRHDFGKLRRLDYLDRLRFMLERRRILDWIAERAEIVVTDRSDRVRGPGGETALDRIERDYRESWHCDKALGRPISRNAGDNRAGDGHTIEHGATVWFADPKGRYRRGVAYSTSGNMWWIACGRYDLHKVASYEILVDQPEDLRRKRNGRKRRAALERELQSAVARMDFLRAETLKRIIFGGGETVRIWSRKNGLWYGPDCRGYSSDRSRAGLYTMAEAEREVRRVPHILEIVTNDGKRIRFDEQVAA